MIEVERKIEVTEKFLAYVKENGKFIGESLITDIYYDTASYTYTLKDTWIRKRENTFELKRGVSDAGSAFIDRYEEITDPSVILTILNIKDTGNLENSLAGAEIYPFAQYITLRTKYEIDGLTIDLDTINLNNFFYSIAEIEDLVAKEEEMADVESRIVALLKKAGVELKEQPLAKLSAYLLHFRPDHFKALRDAKVI